MSETKVIQTTTSYNVIGTDIEIVTQYQASELPYTQQAFLALVGGSYKDALDYLEDSISIFEKIQHRVYHYPISLLAYIDISQGETHKACHHLIEFLENVKGDKDCIPFIRILPSAALYFADQGQLGRAVELYALASRYPLVAKSCWYEDMVGETIREVAASLPQDVAAAYQKQGELLDIWQTAQGLLVELKDEARSAPK